MNDHAPFLAAIVAAPESDGPRLRYADYLEETGNEAQIHRAEFIRLQCALECLAGNDPRQFELRQRENHLIEQYWREWLASLCKALNEPSPRISAPPEPVSKSWYQFWRRTPTAPLAQAGEVYTLDQSEHPFPRQNRVTQHFSGFPMIVAHLERSEFRRDHWPDLEMVLPYLNWAEFSRGFVAALGISLRPQRPRMMLERALQTSPVTRLDLGRATQVDLAELLQPGKLTPVRTLGLTECMPSAVSQLGESIWAQQLTGLEFERIEFSESTESLLKPTHLTSVRKLSFRHCQLNQFSILQLIRSPLMRQIEEFCLVEGFITDREFSRPCDRLVQGLIETPGLERLKIVDLSVTVRERSLKEALRARFGPDGVRGTIHVV